MPKSQHFRANVGIVVLDASGRVLVLERSDMAGRWQLPQGGLDVGEEPRDAVLRELHEETGIDAATVAIVAEHPEWITYEWPAEIRAGGARRGQAQRFFALRASAASVIDLSVSDEFVAYRWLPFAEVIELAFAFRRGVYERIAPWVDEVVRAATRPDERESGDAGPYR